jgi:hypothetical protein
MMVLRCGSVALPYGKVGALAKQVQNSNGGLSKQLNAQTLRLLEVKPKIHMTS